MKLYRYILSFVVILFCLSCGNKNRQKMLGEWAVEQLLVEDKNMTSTMNFNMLSFKKDGSCDLPMVNLHGSEKGEWLIESGDSDVFLIIKAKNSLFARKYKLHFYGDTKRQVNCVELKSDIIKMNCSQFLGS